VLTDTTLIAMLMIAAFLFGVLCYPIVRDVNAALARRWIRRRIAQDHEAWIERRKQYAREALR
jgi:hypothetical protein